jgi:DNA-binding PadR family transcriptional regulator
MTGYELNKEFNESLGNFWQAKPQQIYRELDAMEINGWLISERVIQNEKPNKRVYTITAMGKAVFLDWLSSPEADIKNSMYGKNVFLMRLYFAGETNQEKALYLLQTFKEECLAGIQAMEDIKEVFVRDEAEAFYSHEQLKYMKLTALYGDIVRRARLEWVEKAIAILKNREENNE